jgi:CHAT domain-containing protein
VGHDGLVAYALTSLSVLRSADGYDEEALRGLNEALRVYRRMHNRRGQANVLNEIGRIYQGKGQSNKALYYHRQALPITQAAGDRNVEAATLYQIARVERQLGKLDDALTHITQSDDAIESLRAQIVNPDLRASYFASVQKYSALYIDLLMKMSLQHPEQDFAKRAFELNDNARARSLLEIVAEGRAKIRHGIDPALLARERVLQEQLSGKASYYMRALSGNDKAESQLAEKELREINTSYQELQTQIRQESPLYANLTNPQPLELTQIQAELRDPDVLLLEYALGEETSYVWAVTANSFASFPLPAGSRIEAAANQVNKFLTARQSLAETPHSDLGEQAASSDEDYWPAATALSEMVLGPVAHLLPGKRLLIVADGKLQYMPFDALPNPTQALDRKPVPLALTHEVTNLSSASILSVIRAGKPAEDNGKVIVVLADPVFDKTDPRVSPSDAGSESSATVSRAASEHVSFQNSAMRDIVAPGGTSIPRLLGTRQEAEAIMAVTPSGTGLVATDFNAGRAIAMNGELGHYKIVHFATHGVVNTLHPELSGIMLSLVNASGQSEDGFLQLHDIYNLDLSQTQLVVLSACRTALGKEVKGEGLVGLTRGFMYAGSKSVIASLWKVDDRATAELMKHFYRAMFDEGLPPSAALRKAKEAMWRQPRWHAPYFWAAFVLQGEYRDQIVVKQRSSAAKYITPLAVG